MNIMDAFLGHLLRFDVNDGFCTQNFFFANGGEGIAYKVQLVEKLFV